MTGDSLSLHVSCIHKQLCSCSGGHFTWVSGQAVPRSLRCRVSKPFSKLWNEGGNVHFFAGFKKRGFF